MNPKIKEFVRQCGGVYCYESGEEYAQVLAGNNIEKFAELIVRECANVAAEHEALDIYEEIREHFGVQG
jgi:hypothetical protein